MKSMEIPNCRPGKLSKFLSQIVEGHPSICSQVLLTLIEGIYMALSYLRFKSLSLKANKLPIQLNVVKDLNLLITTKHVSQISPLSALSRSRTKTPMNYSNTNFKYGLCKYYFKYQLLSMQIYYICLSILGIVCAQDSLYSHSNRNRLLQKYQISTKI